MVLMINDLVHLFIIIVILSVMLATLASLLYGYRVQQVAEVGEALYTTLKYVILADDR